MWQILLTSKAAVDDVIQQVKKYGNVIFLREGGYTMPEEVLQYRVMFPEETEKLIGENHYFNVELLKDVLKKAVLEDTATKQEEKE